MAFKMNGWSAFTKMDDKTSKNKMTQEEYDKEMDFLRQYQGKDNIPNEILDRAKKIGLSLEDQTPTKEQD